MRSLGSVLMLMILLLANGVVVGQVTRGNHTGIVNGSSGASIARARMAAKNTATAKELHSTTNDRGTFVFPRSAQTQVLTDAQKNLATLAEGAGTSVAILVELFGIDPKARATFSGTFDDQSWTLRLEGVYLGEAFNVSHRGTFDAASGLGTWSASGSYGDRPWKAEGDARFSDRGHIMVYSAEGTISKTDMVFWDWIIIKLFRRRPDGRIVDRGIEIRTDTGKPVSLWRERSLIGPEGFAFSKEKLASEEILVTVEVEGVEETPTTVSGLVRIRLPKS